MKEDLINVWLNKNAINEVKDKIILRMVIAFKINFEYAEEVYKKWREDYKKARVI